MRNDNLATQQGVANAFTKLFRDAARFHDFVDALNIPTHEAAMKGERAMPHIRFFDGWWTVGDSDRLTLEEAARLFVEQCVEYGAVREREAANDV